MRSVRFRVPSLMMSFGNDTTQKTYAFENYRNNVFLGQKHPVMEIKRLTDDQKKALDLTISDYKLAANRQGLITLLLTALITAALFFWLF